MASTSQHKHYPNPRLSFSTLAKLMGSHTPGAQQTILKGAKYPKIGPALSYVNAVRYLVGDLVGDGRVGGPRRPHEDEIVELVKKKRISLPKGVSVSRPSTRQTPWSFQGVEISVHPDANLTTSGGSGALKIICTQDPLPRGVGGSMACLLLHHRTQVLGDRTTKANLCLIYEVRSGRLHKARPTPGKLMANVQAACQLAQLWWPHL